MTPPLALRPAPAPSRRWLLVGVGVATGGLFGLAWVVEGFGRRERGAVFGRDGADGADLAVVLGARVLPGGEPSRALRARVEQGVRLYHAGRVRRLLFSGGQGLHPPAEAHVMRALARELGVPEAACRVEDESRSTEENARFGARCVRGLGARRVVVVSDAFHLFRARQYFRREGLEVATSPAPREGRFTWGDRLYWTLREALALWLHPRVLLARPPVRPPPGPEPRPD